MYLVRLRDIAAKELKTGVSDVVIAIPGWYADVQRRALLSAASIAGLNPLRLIPDHTAVAFGYGITKSDLPDAENPRHVVFVDIGHSSMSVAVVAFSKGQLTVKSTAYDTHLGGRDIDYALVRHFSEEFKTKYRIDVLSNPKAIFRLYASAEKLKKVLSANAEAPLNVESIMNDVDASSKLTRDQYEQLIADILDRIPGPLQRALEESGLTIEQVDAIELVGGSTRVPAVRAKIQSVFPGKTLSTTLNQDEACARGCTFACATLSPVFRVRDFAIHDVAIYPIKVRWEKSPADEEEDTELVVFPRGNGIPSTKVLTFYRKAPFDIEAVYAEPATLPGSVNPWVGHLAVKDVGPSATGDYSTVRVKARLNLHGILSFEAVYTEEVEEKEEMQVDGESSEPPKKKKVVKKNPVAYVAGYGGLDSSMVDKYKEKELAMYANDKLVQDTEVRCLHSAIHNRILNHSHRNARMLLKNTSTICAQSSRTATLPLCSLRKRTHCLQSYRRMKTGSILKRVKTLQSPPTLPASRQPRSSVTPLRPAGAKLRSDRGLQLSYAKRSINTARKRPRQKSGSRTSMRRTSTPSLRKPRRSRSGWRTNPCGSPSARRTSIPS